MRLDMFNLWSSTPGADSPHRWQCVLRYLGSDTRTGHSHMQRAHLPQNGRATARFTSPLTSTRCARLGWLVPPRVYHTGVLCPLCVLHGIPGVCVCFVCILRLLVFVFVLHRFAVALRVCACVVRTWFHTHGPPCPKSHPDTSTALHHHMVTPVTTLRRIPLRFNSTRFVQALLN